MRRAISAAVQMSIANGDRDIDDYVTRLLHSDSPRAYPILNHRGGQPFLPPDYRTSPDSWETDQHLEEHPYVAVSFAFAGSQNTQAVVEPYPPEYPAHQALRHAADALNMLEHIDAPGNEWERQTMRNQVDIAVRKAMRHVHTGTEEQVDNFLHAALETATPPLAVATAFCVATGNDPHLKRVLTDHVSLPQETVLQEDAADILRFADGKTSPTTVRHLARAMGYLPAELDMQPMPTPPDHGARIIRAAQVVQLPPHLIQQLQRELRRRPPHASVSNAATGEVYG